MVEMLYDPEQRHTEFAVWAQGAMRRVSNMDDGHGRTLVPYAADNKLVSNCVVLFPWEAVDFHNETELIRDIRAYIHRYMDLSAEHEEVAIYYVLLSWVYDQFNELPYLRLLGDYGTGKTRFLMVVGSICYHPIFASGASTVSPLFHLLDRIGGTLILDEADFRASDEKVEIVKILNNGNVRGMPVLRADRRWQREFEPQVFNVFGPKIIAARKSFADDGLESRFITINFENQSLRKDIPINLPASQQEEALHLRNKLLMYRFQRWGTHATEKGKTDRDIDPRRSQIIAPLLSIVSNDKAREDLRRILLSLDMEDPKRDIDNTAIGYAWSSMP